MYPLTTLHTHKTGHVASDTSPLPLPPPPHTCTHTQFSHTTLKCQEWIRLGGGGRVWANKWSANFKALLFVNGMR